MELPKRKPNRLPEYSYDTPNAYFITFCVKDRKCLLWDNTGPIRNLFANTDSVPLSSLGLIVDRTIRDIPKYYPAVSVDHFVIMPNHVHMLLRISLAVDRRPMVAPTVSRILQQMKGASSKLAGFSLWQKGFYDHVIRNDADYLEAWKYIDGNPLKWKEDDLYSQS